MAKTSKILQNAWKLGYPNVSENTPILKTKTGTNCESMLPLQEFS